MHEQPVLELTHVGKKYGRLVVLDGISLSIGPGECRGIVGPNGAGKTTLFNLVAGATRVTSGHVLFKGKAVTHWSEERRARSGIRRTFQRSNLFEGLTVEDNVCIAVQASTGKPHVLHRRRDYFPEIEVEAQALLDTVGLRERAAVPAIQLSHGERRQLEVAMALSSTPSLLLLDEPTAGMTPAESKRFVEQMADLSRSLTMVVVEHDMSIVFAMADIVTVIHAGRVLAEGPPDEVRRSKAARDAYFGASHRLADGAAL